VSREPIDVKISDLTPKHRHVNLRVKVLSIDEPRTVVSRRDGSRHRVADAVVGDETGIIKMALWDDAIDLVSVGDIIKLTNAYVAIFRGRMQLAVGRYGSIEVVGGEDIEVFEDNDMSERLPPRARGRRADVARREARKRRRPR